MARSRLNSSYKNGNIIHLDNSPFAMPLFFNSGIQRSSFRIDCQSASKILLMLPGAKFQKYQYNSGNLKTIAPQFSAEIPKHFHHLLDS